ncbi:Tn3 family transposase [Klebsiella pneumoniae]
MGSCAAPSAKGDDKFITTDYLQQCPVHASELVGSLLKSSRPSGLAQAIMEVGRVNKTLYLLNYIDGTVAKLAMRQPFVLFKGLTFQKLCLPGAFRPGDHHNKMLRPGLCVVHASPQYL